MSGYVRVGEDILLAVVACKSTSGSWGILYVVTLVLNQNWPKHHLPHVLATF